MGHIGLTPQTSAMMGGFKVQGKSKEAADFLVETAKAVEKAGAFLINLEGIPVGVAKRITEELRFLQWVSVLVNTAILRTLYGLTSWVLTTGFLNLQRNTVI